MLSMRRREVVAAVLAGSAGAVAVGKTAETLTDPDRRSPRKGSGKDVGSGDTLSSTEGPLTVRIPPAVDAG